MKSFNFPHVCYYYHLYTNNTSAVKFMTLSNKTKNQWKTFVTRNKSLSLSRRGKLSHFNANQEYLLYSIESLVYQNSIIKGGENTKKFN